MKPHMHKNYGRLKLQSDDIINWPTIAAAIAVGFAMGVTIMALVIAL